MSLIMELRKRARFRKRVDQIQIGDFTAKEVELDFNDLDMTISMVY
ncbi:hypothetical protein KHA80_08295 [Anaerobacillus sp. HL2]|nr:hypothetical protein KHA80_08295 [Anaerobacillus sp. HL2]